MPNTSLAAASCADATSRDAVVGCVSDGLSGLIARSRAGCVIDGHGGFGFGNQIEIALSNWLIAASHLIFLGIGPDPTSRYFDQSQ